MSSKKSSNIKCIQLNDDFSIPRKGKSKNILTNASTASTKKIEDTGKILKYIDDNVIGKGSVFLGPFGRRKVTYADFSSSGRSLQFLEDYINKEVLPSFGDISCLSAVTGLQSQLYCKEAKDIVSSAINISENDHLFFCESSSICPSERLCYLLCYENENNSKNLNNEYQEKSKNKLKPVLFVSINESSKNLAPWIKAEVELVKISKTHEGFLDLVDLEKKLMTYTDSKRLLIGLFAAASRITGIIADDIATTILLHQYGAIAVWDYSLVAPYGVIDMNPSLPGASKDVIFFDTTKFIGGVQGPSVFVIKKQLAQIEKENKSLEIQNNVGVISCIRAGLVVHLKESLRIQNITNRLEKLCKQILLHIRTIPEIILLGPSQTTTKRLPIICFLVKHPRGLYIHHKFVVAILNDVFGIQATACNHTGQSMGISKKLAADYKRVLDKEPLKHEYLRPGYTKLLFPFFISESEMAFILEALKMVATEAWKLLPQYEIDESGEWKHYSNSLIKERKWMGSIRYNDGRMTFTDRRISGPGSFPQSHSDCLQTARNLFSRARKMAQKSSKTQLEIKLSNFSAEMLRWFMLPGEAHQLLIGQSQNVKNTIPFDPNKIKTKDPGLFLNMLRHNSLSVLDLKHFKNSYFSTSTTHIPVKCHNNTKDIYCSNSDQFPSNAASPTSSILNQCRFESTNRNRCHSWSSTTKKKSSFSPNKLTFAPQINNTNSAVCNTKISNIVTNNAIVGKSNNAISPISSGINKRQISCSCSMQTDLYSPQDYVNNSPTPSLQNSVQNESTCSDCTEEIQAYVEEVTKELATEIKSEIREVISKVENVLENSDCTELGTLSTSSLSNLNGSGGDSRSDSVSATDVAQYLKEYSKEMTSEVTSEIREVITDLMPLNESFSSLHSLESLRKNKSESEKNDLSQDFNNLKSFGCLSNKKGRNMSEENIKSLESMSRPHSMTSWHLPITAASPENSTPNCPYTGAISKLKDPFSTTSQDSGINICFHEQCEAVSGNSQEIRLSDEREQVSSQLSSDSLQTSIHSDIHDQSVEFNKWHHLPKEVWKTVTEAIDEFDMVKEGDRILVCISGSSSSLLLLNALRQFSRARGLHIEMAAITVGKCSVDPRALMLYMRDLKIDLFIEQIEPSESFRQKIFSIARRKKFNVLAMGNTLEKVADCFIMSLFQKGKLHTLQAHCINREGDLRIIRPFIYVRERILDDFSIQKNLPSYPSSTLTKLSSSKLSDNILKVQESINPSVYENIKNAIKPLLSMKNENLK